ncbi:MULTISPECIES: 5-formyltetrahydrofolate cyclo-ligase [unclassified Clostridium]|uniref:5-formyltetrahydrofolate cyclo-ligase n=1 Tax=unclassified Clostridium TaxID=2614128 RepID=UPI0002985D8A|nr:MULTISPECIES: 5-formyltetrahydrofolate cyclo-ligase [unclassified Clostridium]EKQ52250.1 MAG: 5,10-methenyltetrahydrofolate synthetase [Clostridium sp. Maddingley MBC34-26]
MSIFENKKALRKEILIKRKNMNTTEKEKMDKMISDQLYESRYYKEATNIFIYISYDSEIDTKSIICKALKDNKRIYIPRTEFETRIMDAVEIKSFDNLIETNYGLLEPSKKDPHINPNELDLIVVPGVAFDRNGGRMGYGAGFYDRFFKKINGDNIKKITKLALAYSLQVLDKVPMSEQDVPVDFIITEKEFIG